MSLELLRQKVKEKCENNPHLDFKPVDKIPNTKLHSYIKEVVKNSLKRRYNIFIQELLNEKDTISFRESFLSSAYINLFSTDTVIGEKLEKRFEKCIPLDERVTKNLIDGEEINDRSIDFFAVFADYKGGQNFLDICRSNCQTVNPEDAQKIEQQKNTESIDIPGVTIIDSKFLDRVRNIQEITKSHFFAGIHSNHAQFYGVLHQYDIEREGFQEFKNIVLSSFKGLNDYKISAVISGDGGSGKSTFLRRLAIELFQFESFEPTVLWLDSKISINQFLESGFRSLKEQSSTKFLLIIEDWHKSLNKVPKDQIVKLLSDLNSCDHLRITIGDRDADRKPYLEYLNGSISDVFRLSHKENKKIISQIVKDYPEWQKTVKTLSEGNLSYRSTLYQLLFIIQNLALREYPNSPVNPKEIQRTFINIIESDLRVIYKEYPGLAKALYYWGCIYTKQKFFITYRTFLEIAEFLNRTNGEIVSHFYKHDESDSTHEKLKIYISEGINGNLLFNHDLLAESGLNEISMEELPSFNKSKVIDIIKYFRQNIDSRDKASFCSNVLCSPIFDFFENQQIKKEVFHTLLLHPEYFDSFYILFFTIPSVEYTENLLKIIETEIYFLPFWDIIFLESNSEIIETSIVQSKLLNVLNTNADIHFKLKILWHFKDQVQLQEIIEKTITKKKDSVEINTLFVGASLFVGAKLPKVHKYCLELLSRKDVLDNISHEIICIALIVTRKNRRSIEFCNTILISSLNEGQYANFLINEALYGCSEEVYHQVKEIHKPKPENQTSKYFSSLIQQQNTFQRNFLSNIRFEPIHHFNLFANEKYPSFIFNLSYA